VLVDSQLHLIRFHLDDHALDHCFGKQLELAPGGVAVVLRRFGLTSLDHVHGLAETELRRIQGHQTLTKSVFRQPLQIRVHCQVDLVAGFIERIMGAVALLDSLPHHLEKVRAAGHRFPVQLRRERLFKGGRARGGFNETELEHAPQHLVTPRLRTFRPTDGVKLVIGTRNHAREQSRLCDGQLGGRLVEVQPRRRLDAICAVAEEDLVCVHGDDLVLGVALLDVDGEQRLLDLARELALTFQEQVEGQLLGQRGRAATRADPAIDDGVPHSAENRFGIDAAVLVELGVLNGYDRELEVVRDFTGLELHPPFAGERSNELTVLGIDMSGGRRSKVLENIHFGHV